MNGDNQPEKPAIKPKKNAQRKKWFVIFTVVVLILVAGAVGGWVYVSYQKSQAADKLAAQQSERNTVISQTGGQAQTIVNNGGKASQAGAVYEKAINSTTDSTLKYNLLMDEATMYFNANDFSQALTIALQAESVDKDANVEQFIAQIYESMGDKTNAIKYYQSAILLVDTSQPMGSSDVQYYQSKVESLGGTINK
ncbi:MAG TPA: hypothetical protein VMR16_02630 [Candidatus Saccharimonadales bacterium]|nr:hypothetical protein [Candidatus Saccharimonadales bacterium]